LKLNNDSIDRYISRSKGSTTLKVFEECFSGECQEEIQEHLHKIKTITDNCFESFLSFSKTLRINQNE
jgi:hypothetical protein